MDPSVFFMELSPQLIRSVFLPFLCAESNCGKDFEERRISTLINRLMLSYFRTLDSGFSFPGRRIFFDLSITWPLIHQEIP